MATRFARSRNARKVVERAGRPGLERAGRKIAREIVANVPVRTGVAVSTYDPKVDVVGDEVRVSGFGSFWHLLEYGTLYTPAYRPIERGVLSVVKRWEAH